MSSARNIELKARLPNLAAAREIARRLSTAYLGIEHQTDTFFHCARGRLKLREIRTPGAPPKALLIPYARENRPDAKASDYQLVEVTDADALKQALATALGVQVVVSKQREIFLHENVRIHLDEVASLGAFLEFEAVLQPGLNDSDGHAQLSFLQQEFGIGPTDLVSVAYADLLLRRTAE